MKEKTGYWSKKEDEVLKLFHTSRDGISSSEAESRQKLYGLNQLKRKSVIPPLILRQLKNPLVWLLAGSSIIAMFFGEMINSILILIMIFLVSLVSFFQEYRSERIVEDLRKKISYKAIVVRNGRKEEIDVKNLVPGDIVELSTGSIIPADLRLIETRNMEVNEAVLTGESLPVTKHHFALKNFAQDPINYAFAGTTVLSGRGLGVVISIAEQTQLGKISKEAVYERPETDFQKDLKHFVNFLIGVIFSLTGIILIAGIIFKHNFLDSLLFALAVAIGIAPEMLPVILTIGLAKGASIMAKKEVIVKRMISIEDFGNMDVLCTDKTGTITEGSISLYNHVDTENKTSDEVLLYGVLCNSAIEYDHKISGNPIDAAILQHANERIKERANSYKKIDEVPFDYERKRMSVIVKSGKDNLMIAKGATHSILRKCSKISINGRITSITHYSEKLSNKFVELANKGLRVIAVAYKKVSYKKKYNVTDEQDLIFFGFITLFDPPKKAVKESLNKLKVLGIDFKILTGDNEIITKKIAKDVGIPIKNILIADEIKNLDEESLKKAVEDANIFCRLTPELKLKIIRALKSNGHDVGYMGDGVNDVLALHEADVAISVNTAVDVAKDVSDIILLRKNLDILAEGVAEGRKIFSNSMKYILMGTSSDFGNMLSMSVASFFLPFPPLLPPQVLLNDLLYDVSQISIPNDNVDRDSIKKPKKFNLKSIKSYMLFFGPISSLYDFLTFGIMFLFFHASAVLFRTGWFLESIATQTLVVFVIRTRKVPFWKSRPGKWVFFSCLSVVALALLIPFTPIGKLFNFAPLPGLFFVFLAAMVITYLALVELGKKFFFKRYEI